MKEDNIKEIVEQIFSDYPKPYKYCALQLDNESLEYSNGDLDTFIFNILYEITYRGMKKIFGINKEIYTLTYDEYKLLNKYVNSFGYNLEIFINNEKFNSNTIVNNEEDCSIKISFINI